MDAPAGLCPWGVILLGKASDQEPGQEDGAQRRGTILERQGSDRAWTKEH